MPHLTLEYVLRGRKASLRDDSMQALKKKDDVIDELVGAIGTSHGSVGQWLNTSATPLEKRNFVEFVQCLEEFEGRHGLTPANRSADDVSGTINLALGPTIKCSLKFLV